VILDANERIGDSWRKRWDSLRLFTPAKYDGLAGMRFPAPRVSFPTKDEMGDYLAAYAARFELPVRSGVRVDALSKEGDRYLVSFRHVPESDPAEGRQRPDRGRGELGRRDRPGTIAYAPYVAVRQADGPDPGSSRAYRGPVRPPLATAGVERLPRVVGVRDGLPLLQDQLGGLSRVSLECTSWA
jgi:hypothetical protein